VLAATVYGLRQPAVRVATIDVFGQPPSQSEFEPLLSQYARVAMQGYYLGIIPRDSVFFFPREAIREQILAEHKEIAAVSIFWSSLTSISIKVDVRTAIARWCGIAPTPGVEAYCYVFDANGILFAALPESGATSTIETVNPFTLYAPLAGGTSTEPLDATIAGATELPATFDFARQLSTFQSSVRTVTIRDGEVTDELSSGTRITYVLGNEQNAFTALVSAKDSFNLVDGSVDYVDLRFDGKVYLKKKE
jgi:hypothetical protein